MLVVQVENLRKSMATWSQWMTFRCTGYPRERDPQPLEQSGERVTIHSYGEALVSVVINLLTRNGIRFRDFRTEQPTF